MVTEGLAMIGGSAAPADGEIAQKDGERVREHVSRVAEEGKAVADEPAHNLQDRQGQGEGENQEKFLFPFHEKRFYLRSGGLGKKNSLSLSSLTGNDGIDRMDGTDRYQPAIICIARPERSGRRSGR